MSPMTPKVKAWLLSLVLSAACAGAAAAPARVARTASVARVDLTNTGYSLDGGPSALRIASRAVGACQGLSARKNGGGRGGCVRMNGWDMAVSRTWAGHADGHCRAPTRRPDDGGQASAVVRCHGIGAAASPRQGSCVVPWRHETRYATMISSKGLPPPGGQPGATIHSPVGN